MELLTLNLPPIMRKLRLSLYVFLGLFLFQTKLLAQTTVKGQVVSAVDGSPIPGVTIIEEGELNGTITDVEGIFEITVKNASASKLTFSFIGYKSQTVAVANSTSIFYYTYNRFKVYGTRYKVRGKSILIRRLCLHPQTLNPEP